MSELNLDFYKFLSMYSLQINTYVPDYLKCTKCRGVLIEARETPCGCRYCRLCVDEILSDGIRICQGNTEKCKIAQFSQIQIDHRTNKKISNLEVKCIKTVCTQRVELIDLEQHLKLCTKKRLQCPYFELGCVDGKLTRDNIEDHLHSKILIHSKVLIDMIHKMKNEISALKQNLIMKDEILEFMNDEIRMAKTVNEDLVRQINILRKDMEKKRNDKDGDVNLTNLNDTIEMDIIKELKSLTLEMSTLDRKVERYNLNSQDKIEKITEELERKFEVMQHEYQENLKSPLSTTNNDSKRFKTRKTPIIKELSDDTEITTNGEFVWLIDEVTQRRLVSNYIFSDYFYPEIGSYKMALKLSNNGYGFDVQLCIFTGSKDANLNWPFREDVTITIINENNLEASHSITKQCKISKPSHFTYRSSESFFFCNFDFCNVGFLQGRRINIQCQLSRFLIPNSVCEILPIENIISKF